jgi:hypothetical protein
MTIQPPAKPPRIVFARTPGRKRARPVAAPVASPTRIVFYRARKQRDTWQRFLQLTGRDD